MNKKEVISMYAMEGLIPIVKRLTEQFTSYESSSVTYERARQFMEAVIYCIAHCDYEAKNTLMVSKLGNLNYRDTVEKTLFGFFLYYDVKFAPMETIITMDYPILGLDMTLEGIDMIAQYIDAIWKEQQYLNKFPREYIIEELRLFHQRYEKEFFNIKEIVELQIENG